MWSLSCPGTDITDDELTGSERLVGYLAWQFCEVEHGTPPEGNTSTPWCVGGTPSQDHVNRARHVIGTLGLTMRKGVE